MEFAGRGVFGVDAEDGEQCGWRDVQNLGDARKHSYPWVLDLPALQHAYHRARDTCPAAQLLLAEAWSLPLPSLPKQIAQFP